MITRPLMISCMAAVIFLIITAPVQAQDTPNKLDDKGRQGAWKVLLGSRLGEVEDSANAEYYRIADYKDDQPIGAFKDYYLTGELYREGVFVSYRNRSVLDGVVRWYRVSGSLKLEETYLKGELQGRFVMYTPEGNKMTEGEWDDGKKSGEWINYYPSGGILSKGRYSNDLQEGEWINYLENGQVRETSIYVDGKRMDHNRLVTQCEDAIENDKLDDAERYLESAKASVIALFGPNAPTLARIYFLRSRIAIARGNELNALAWLDSATNFCRALGSMDNSRLRAGYMEVMSQALDDRATSVSDRLFTELMELVRTDSLMNYEQAMDALEYCGREARIQRSKERFRQVLNMADASLAWHSPIHDSAYAHKTFDYWSWMGNGAGSFGDVELLKRCLKKRSMIESLDSLTKIDSLRAAHADVDAYAFILDGSLTKADVERKFDSLVVVVREEDDRLVCDLIANVCSGSSVFFDRSLLRYFLTYASPSCLQRGDWISSTILFGKVITTTIERQCDSARYFLTLYEDIADDNAYYLAQHTELQRVVSGCRGEQVTSSDALAMPVLFTEREEVDAISQEELLRKLLPERADVLIDALADDASSEDRLLALINLDTTLTDNEVETIIGQYRSMRDQLLPLSEQGSSHAESAEKLFRGLHDSVLKKYEEVPPFVTVFRNGTYNCASAVAVYSLLCQDAGIPLKYFYAPSHITCGIPDADTIIQVELTSPVHGFGIRGEKDSLLNHLLEYKLISEEEMEEYGPDSLLREYLGQTERASFASVLSAIAANANYRAYEADEYSSVSSSIDREVRLAAVLLDTHNILGLAYMWAEMSDTNASKKHIEDMLTVAAYFKNDTTSLQYVVAAMMIPLLGLATTSTVYDPQPVCQTLFNTAPPREDAPTLADIIQTTSAMAMALSSQKRGDINTAYAFVKYYINDSVFYMNSMYTYKIREEFAQRKLDDGQWSQALEALTQRRDVYLEPVSIYGFSELGMDIVDVGLPRGMDTIVFREVSGMLLRSSRVVVTSSNKLPELRQLVESCVKADRHEYAFIACEEAEKWGRSTTDVQSQRKLVDLMIANRDLNLSTEGVSVQAKLHLGSATGPSSHTLTPGVKPVLVLSLDGLTIGQRFTITVTPTYPGSKTSLPIQSSHGAPASSMTLALPLTPPQQGNGGNGTIALQIDGRHLEPLKFTVR